MMFLTLQISTQNENPSHLVPFLYIHKMKAPGNRHLHQTLKKENQPFFVLLNCIFKFQLFNG